MIETLDGKRVMHIDTSCKLYEKEDTAIAFKILKTGAHKGLVLKNRLKRSLDKEVNADQDYARLYTICIQSLIKEELDNFDTLIICGDENFTYVKLYLDYLFLGNLNYEEKKIMSIGDLRELTGNPKFTSQADKIANAYRRKATKGLWRQQKGIPLNIIELTYAQVISQWGKLEVLKDKSGGE
jgi:hypothetical protein